MAWFYLTWFYDLLGGCVPVSESIVLWVAIAMIATRQRRSEAGVCERGFFFSPAAVVTLFHAEVDCTRARTHAQHRCT